MPHLVSMQVGLPQAFGTEEASNPMDRPWTTGFFKTPVTEPLWLSRTNLTGDGQADRKNHGGPDKAVLAYAFAHYPAWCAALNQPQLPYGAFGENFTVDGQTESSVCIGDIYAVGQAIVQVSQPRRPCWKLARRWRVEDLVERVITTGRTGWYLRVLQEGYVEPNASLVLRDRPYPQWSVTRANQLMYHQVDDPQAKAQLAQCPLLSPNWRQKLGASVNPTAG